MKTSISLEWDGNLSEQVRKNPDNEYELSEFLKCLISDALRPFIEERKNSNHKVGNCSLEINGYKITISVKGK